MIWQKETLKEVCQNRSLQHRYLSSFLSSEIPPMFTGWLETKPVVSYSKMDPECQQEMFQDDEFSAIEWCVFRWNVSETKPLIRVNISLNDEH